MASKSYSKMLQKKTDVSPGKKSNLPKPSNEDQDTYINSMSAKCKTHVSKYDMEEAFDIKCSHVIDECFYSIKSDCEMASSGILANEQYSSLFDFHELIRNNVDLNDFYKKTMDS